MPITSISLNDFQAAAANAAAPAACLRVDANGVRAVSSARAFFTLGATHRHAMAAFVDALKQRYGEGIGTMVAIRQGLQAGPMLNARMAKRITGQAVRDAIAEAERIRTTHAVLLDIFRRGRMPEDIEALPEAWQRALDPEGSEDAVIAKTALAEGHDLQSAIQNWADAWHLPLLPGEKEVLAEAVYGELAEKPRAEFENAETLYDRIKEGDCQILNQWLAVSTTLATRTALAGFTGADAASLRAFVAGRLCHCDAIRRGGYATGPELEALVQEVQGDWEALSDERLRERVGEFDPAFAARLSREDLARLRETVMARLGRAYAERPEGQAWNPSFRLEAARREVIAASLPSPLEKACHQSLFCATNGIWRENVHAIQANLAEREASLAEVAGSPDNAQKMRAALLAEIAADPASAAGALTAEDVDDLCERYHVAMAKAVRDARSAIGLAVPTFTLELRAALTAGLFEAKDGVMRFTGKDIGATISRARVNRISLQREMESLFSARRPGANAEVKPEVAAQRFGIADDPFLRSALARELLRRADLAKYALDRGETPEHYRQQAEAVCSEVLADLTARRRQIDAANLGPKARQWMQGQLFIRRRRGGSSLCSEAQLAEKLDELRPAGVVAALQADFQAIWRVQRRSFGEGQAINSEALRQLKKGEGRLSRAVQAALIDAALDTPKDDGLPPTQDEATTALRQAMDVLLTNMATVHAARTLRFSARGALAYRLQHDLPLCSADEVQRLIAGGTPAITGEMLRVLAASPDEAHWEMLLSVACDGKPAEQDWAEFCAACVDGVPPEMRARIAASLAETEGSKTPFGHLRAGRHTEAQREDYEKAWQPRAFAGISPARAQAFLEALAAALSIPDLSFDEQEVAS